jgi:hypothetical protein
MFLMMVDFIQISIYNVNAFVWNTSGCSRIEWVDAEFTSVAALLNGWMQYLGQRGKRDSEKFQKRHFKKNARR